MDEDEIIKEKQIKIDELSISEIEELIKRYKRKIVDLEKKISEKKNDKIQAENIFKKNQILAKDFT